MKTIEEIQQQILLIKKALKTKDVSEDFAKAYLQALNWVLK